MKYSLIPIIFFLISCSSIEYSTKKNNTYSSKGFAYIYNENDFQNNIIKKKLDNSDHQIAHSKLRPGTWNKIIKLKTNQEIILQNTKRFEYPDFYKILITNQVASKLQLDLDLPLVEIFEVKKNKSFIAKKTKIFKEEEKIHNNAPVETVTINNISKTNRKKKTQKEKLYIIVAEFYSKDSALALKKRITNDLTNFNAKKLYIKSKKANRITLLSGPYSTINSMKNDYIQLKNFGFEELDISINE